MYNSCHIPETIELALLLCTVVAQTALPAFILEQSMQVFS